MNKLLPILILMLLSTSGCQWFKSTAGGPGVQSSAASVPGIGQTRNVLSDPFALTESSQDTVFRGGERRAPYLGNWWGRDYIKLDYHDLPLIDGVHELFLEIREDGYGIAETDALAGLPLLVRLGLKSAAENEFINIDWDNTDVVNGKIATNGLEWKKTADPGIYILTLNIKDDPFVLDIRFESRDAFGFYWEDSSGEHGIQMLRI